MKKTRDQQGRYQSNHTDEEILGAVRTHEPAATSEVAGELDLTRQAVDHRLRRLRDEGRVHSKKIGASLVWFAPEQSATPAAERETTGSGALDGTGLDDVEFPSGRGRDKCEAAVDAAREHLREHGPATKRDLIEAIMPDHPLGYNVDAALNKIERGDRYRGAWWRRVVKPGLKALPDVEAPPQGASEWRYTGEA